MSITHDIFLSTNEVADLTDIRTGKAGKSREQRQIAALKRMKIPFHESAIGRPKVARAVFNGVVDVQQSNSWEPAMAGR
jgi:hypothetical protein